MRLLSELYYKKIKGEYKIKMLIFKPDMIELIKEKKVLRNMIYFAETQSVTDKIYKEMILTLIVKDVNILSEVCERGEEPGLDLKSAALSDIREVFAEFFNPQTPAWFNSYAPSKFEKNINFPKYNIKMQELCSLESPQELLDGIIDFYKTFGGGDSNNCLAFKWDSDSNKLAGIDIFSLDRCNIDDLYCIDYQKNVICENTELFLNGDNLEKRANNILLEGDSGMGKSTLVKAVLNKYYPQGLRLIELDKQEIIYFEKIAYEIKNKNLKYIIFIDDLSFETNETEYKIIKSIIDGKITKQPNNILIYATSNRKHLIRETWQDREGDDVHVNDTKNELMSLSERFGIKLSFTSCTKQEYLYIVENLLKSHTINTEEIENENLKEKSLVFALKYNGFSGRTARQFINSI